MKCPHCGKEMGLFAAFLELEKIKQEIPERVEAIAGLNARARRKIREFAKRKKYGPGWMSVLEEKKK